MASASAYIFSIRSRYLQFSGADPDVDRCSLRFMAFALPTLFLLLFRPWRLHRNYEAVGQLAKNPDYTHRPARRRINSAMLCKRLVTTIELLFLRRGSPWVVSAGKAHAQLWAKSKCRPCPVIAGQQQDPTSLKTRPRFSHLARRLRFKVKLLN